MIKRIILAVIIVLITTSSTTTTATSTIDDDSTCWERCKLICELGCEEGTSIPYDCPYSTCYEQCRIDRCAYEPSNCAASLLLENDQESIELLKQFRDEKLMNSEIGKALIRLYYKYGDVFNQIVEENSTLKKLSKKCIRILIYIIEKNL